MVVLSVAISLGVVLALAIVHRYSLRRLLVADLLVAFALAGASRFRLHMPRTAVPPGVGALIPLALLALCAWRFFPPSEYVIGGRDPGVYVNEGVQIAQRGAIVVHDETVALVPLFARDLFYPSYRNADYYSIRFMGFFIQAPEDGTVVGQFPHLYPASIAIGYGLEGLTGARRAVGVWAILGVLAVYFTGVRLFGRLAGGAAATLLALSVVEVWFARYPSTEVVMQALLFAAILANARAHVDGDRFFAPVAGFLLGLLLFLRFDAVVAVSGVIAGQALGLAAGQRTRATFWLPLVLLTAACLWYLAGLMRAYFALPLAFFRNNAGWPHVFLAVLAVA